MSEAAAVTTRTAPAYEQKVGIELYTSDRAGLGGKLRTLPLDFVVEEVGRLPCETLKGRFTIARVRSLNWENNRLVRAMAQSLNISRKRIGFAGTKDKRALTTQFFSFKLPVEPVMALELSGVQVLNAYRANRPLTVGMLRANRFTLRLRELEGWEAEALRRRLAEIRADLEAQGGFPNFFGLQRFGTVRPITHLVGAALVRRDYAGAVLTYVTKVSPLEPAAEQAARHELASCGDWSSLLERFPTKLTFERTLVHHLAHHPGDHVGALTKLPDNLLQMFVHAYQSQLFNCMLSRRMAQGLPLDRPVEGDLVVPVDRHGQPLPLEPIPVTDFNRPKLTRRCQEGRAYVTGMLFGLKVDYAGGPMGEIEREVVAKAGVKRRDFIIYNLPHISSMGRRRPLLCRPLHLQLVVEQAPKALINGRDAAQHNGERRQRALAMLPLAPELDPDPGGPGSFHKAEGDLEWDPEQAPPPPATGGGAEPRPPDQPYWQLSDTETELTVRMGFTLPKGSYATMLAREFMKADLPMAY